MLLNRHVLYVYSRPVDKCTAIWKRKREESKAVSYFMFGVSFV